MSQFILNESPEIRSGEDLTWVRRILHAFPAFKNRNYRYYFVGQSLSLVGTWLQIVAQGWLVFELTHSAFWVGAVTAAASLPSLLLSLWGGVIVDRFPKKKILLCTQATAMILAFILGILCLAHIVTVTQITILAFLLGIVTAIDAPARQAFVVELVDKSHLSSAIALNSASFNVTRIIGPSIAGFLIALTGVGVAFVLNAVSYIAVLIALVAIHPHTHTTPIKEGSWQAIRTGVRYAFTHPVIGVFLIYAAGFSIFGWSYSTMMPVLAKNVFHVDATGLGQLYAASGLGAVVATIIISMYSERLRPSTFIVGGSTIFGVAMLLFSMTSRFEWGLVWLFFIGLGLLTQMATLNTTIQRLVEEQIRGRVMSLYILMFVGFMPLGSLQVGYLMEHFGPAFTLTLNAVVVMIMGFGLLMYRGKMRQAHTVYRQRSSS